MAKVDYYLAGEVEECTREEFLIYSKLPHMGQMYYVDTEVLINHDEEFKPIRFLVLAHSEVDAQRFVEDSWISDSQHNIGMVKQAF